VFHIELRQFPHVARAFNLSAEQLEQRILGSWRRGAQVELQERHWDPRRAKLTVYEGPELDPSEIGLGRGWANVTRKGTEVTEQLQKAAAPAAGHTLDELESALATRSQEHPLTLAEAAAVARELGFAAEEALWQLLREERLKLTR
jgi:hypothetical protein